MSVDFDNFSWDSMKDNLQSNINGSQKSKYKPDERFWKLSRDENDTGVAIIRLIPDKTGVPYIKFFSYSFDKFTNGNKYYFIENAPESIKLPDPVKEYRAELLQEGTEEAKTEADKYKRSTKFITNIYVVKDPLNPQNEGKTFLWEFGPKLESKIRAWLEPSDDEIALGEEAKDVYNPNKNGHNIKLKIKKSAGFFNYDDTTITPSGTPFSSKKEFDVALENTTILKDDFLAPGFYKGYDELKEKFLKFVSGDKTPTPKKESRAKSIEDDESPAPKREKAPKKESSDEDDLSWLD